jgi:hypothetical protein
MLIDGAFFDAIVCPYADVMGVAVFAMAVYGALGIALYIYSGNAVLPLVLTLILGGVVVTQLPGPAVQLVGVVALLLIAAGGYWLTVNRGPAR